jgi:D-tyrosyl-tRNA(Tyr) deacylase
MRAILQRVSHASVIVDSKITGQIQIGLLILLGIVNDDVEEDIEWLVNKCANLRIFSDDEGKMNKSIMDIGGSFLVVSQFTLYASTKKGNRPSFIKSARPEYAIPLYEQFCKRLGLKSNLDVQKGIFGADMKVELLNDGPVTIIMDSKIKE